MKVNGHVGSQRGKKGTYRGHIAFSSSRRKSTCALVSESLHYDRIQQGHMLSSSDWELVCSVEMDDLRDGGKGRAVLAEYVTSISRLGELHVHEALTTPDREEEGNIQLLLLDSIQS